MSPQAQDGLRVALAQISPVWLDRSATLQKIMGCVSQAADEGADLVTFGEALLPGYPFWVERTGGARFNDERQKNFYALYLDQGVVIERGDLAPLCDLARQKKIAVYLGIMERAPDRGGHTLYASIVYISPEGIVGSVHRKLQPTYDERLVWGPSDGHGLRVHPLGNFTVGGLNCWENWLPLARASLYGQGEDLHVSIWPGGLHNTQDLPVFIAKEARSYVIAVSGLMRKTDIPDDFPHADEIAANAGDFMANGASCIAAPDGSWVIEPVIGEEALLIADIDQAQVRRERQNLDVVGHYSRPDVTRLMVNRERQSTVQFKDQD
ncbi:carbon-nitrogen hydrolase family protein [Parvularcula sp. IMCC14364]|uniref:carbon-nitrogen hydrolase family protein n=1 Tax=Parvularcula sp. IMCC14364 TaxID=3067902 RepID=UPI003558F22B